WFLFSSRRRHTSLSRDWSSDVCSSDLSQIRLHGLAGDPSWGAHPENALNVLRFAKDELALKRIQFDVEVWALDEWDADQSDTLRSEERRAGKEGRWRRARCSQTHHGGG